MYLGTRVLLLVVAILDGALRHHAILNELANWDGLWYRWLRERGLPPPRRPLLRGQRRDARPVDARVLPAVPAGDLAVGAAGDPAERPLAIWSITLAGVIVSTIGGLICTILVQELASGWWGESAGRRAAVLFCLFPGSVVFSMVYAEGIALPLAAGCILALERRRWLLAGVLAGFATAREPQSLVLIPVCAVSAGLELRRRGWRDREARRSLLAPLLSLTGAVALGAFLWAWAGTPFAISQRQRIGWMEKTDPLALVHLVRRLADQISFSHFNHPTINLNLVVGVARRDRADRAARADVEGPANDLDRGDRVDARDQLPGGHLRVRATQSAAADHRVPGGDRARLLRQGQARSACSRSSTGRCSRA